MSPLPGHQVISDGWSVAHRPVAEATHNATMTLHAGTTGPAPFPPDPQWSPDGDTLTPAPVRCRVQRLVSENTTLQGEQVNGTRRYQITAPVDVVPDLTITDHGPVLRLTGGDDPGLTGARLKVVDEQLGSYSWERVLIAVHNQTQD